MPTPTRPPIRTIPSTPPPRSKCNSLVAIHSSCMFPAPLNRLCFSKVSALEGARVARLRVRDVAMCICLSVRVSGRSSVCLSACLLVVLSVSFSIVLSLCRSVRLFVDQPFARSVGRSFQCVCVSVGVYPPLCSQWFIYLLQFNGNYKIQWKEKRKNAIGIVRKRVKDPILRPPNF